MGSRCIFSIFCLVLHFCVFVCSTEAAMNYAGHKVIRMVPRTESHLQVIRVLRSADNELDFWTEPTGVDAGVDVRVHPDVLEELTNTLLEESIEHSVVIEDVQEAIDRQQDEASSNDVEETIEPKKPFIPRIAFTKYHRIDTIYKYLEDLALAYPHIVKIESIGKSYQNRSMTVVKDDEDHKEIGSNSDSNSNSSKPAVWLDAGIHAREWIAPATALYIIDQLIKNYEDHQHLVDEVDWYILPSANPDGYEFTHTDDRFWRKTMSKTYKRLCPGIDANRNFGFHFNEGGTSRFACSEVYRGPKAFSESESQAMADFLQKHKDSLKLYLSLHAYGQWILTPWAYTEEIPSDYNEMYDLMANATQNMAAVKGEKYTIGQVTHLLYVASGSSTDYAKGAVGIKYAYTIELRDTGDHGFLLPASQIIPTGKEMWETIKYLGKAVSNM